MGTRHLLQESGTEIRRSVCSADGARKGAIGVFLLNTVLRGDQVSRLSGAQRAG